MDIKSELNIKYNQSYLKDFVEKQPESYKNAYSLFQNTKNGLKTFEQFEKNATPMFVNLVR